MPQKNDFIPARIKAQLLALGIPAAQHTPDALAGIFPEEFNIGAAGLDAEDLAKVLIHFSRQGIIAIPQTGVGTSIRKVQPGWHFCRFYRDFNQLLDMVAPYMAEGLKNGEGCLWVLPKPVASEAACASLAPFLKNVESYLASGQLELLSHPSWYLNSMGHLKSFEEISGALLRKQDEALAKGFKFLRAAGDAGWVSGTEQSKGFIEYEMKVNKAIGATKVAAMCTFRADVTADELVAIVTAHQDALYQAPPA
jgi:hypothetical protein